MAAAVVGSQTELVTGQYCVTGKSILCKKWYGSYAIRFNLKTLHFEIPWIKYSKSGPETRMLVELKRKDRIMTYTKALYTHPETIIPPFIPMEKFLADYKNGFIPPKNDVNTPTQIGMFG